MHPFVIYNANSNGLPHREGMSMTESLSHRDLLKHYSFFSPPCFSGSCESGYEITPTLISLETVH